MKSIHARIEALQKAMEETFPNGGLLITLESSYLAISATTIKNKNTVFATAAEALDALKDCKNIWEIN